MLLTDLLSHYTDRCNLRGVKESSRYEQILPLFSPITGISKNLFQICLRGRGEDGETVLSSLPAPYHDNIRNLSDRNPDWEYHLYSDCDAEAFIHEVYGDGILGYYKRINPDYLAARADFLRYLLLYARGGVYLDLKSSIQESLSDMILDDDCFLVFHWDNIPGGQRHCLINESLPQGEMLQGFIVSAAGHPFLRSVILELMRRMDLYNPFTDGVGWAGVLKTTGPVLYTETITALINDPDSKYPFREEKPFEHFGYQVSFLHDYAPGEYQQKISLKDYRKLTSPVVRNKSVFVHFVNSLYLIFLRLWRRITKR